MTRAVGGSLAARAWQSPQCPQSTSRNIGLEIKVNLLAVTDRVLNGTSVFDHFPHARAWGVLLHSARISWRGPFDEHFSVSTQRDIDRICGHAIS